MTDSSEDRKEPACNGLSSGDTVTTSNHDEHPKQLVAPALAIDFDAVAREVAAGYISEQQHPSAPYRILNYTQHAQFDWRWNQETIQCRGLIVDDHNRVIARPFPKFFSYEQLNGNVPREPFEVYDKLDGSLGVLYRINGRASIASRGSFVSNQAQRATAIFNRKYADVPLDDRMTYLFEIIYPQNRIVIDYGTTEDLFLLAIIETATGVEQPLRDIGFPCVTRFDGITQLEELLARQDRFREGFVVRFESGQRVKIKFEEYKRLHKLLTGVSASHIWQSLRNGDDLSQLVERVPDEYFAWVRSTESDLRQKFEVIETRFRQQFAASPRFETRKEAAFHFQQLEQPGVMFAMLDDRPYADQIWKMIRPIGQAPFRCEIDV